MIVLAVVVPTLIVAAVVAGYCYWKRKRAQIHEADSLNNKSTAHRDTIKGSTEFDISAADEFSLATKYGTKWGHKIVE